VRLLGLDIATARHCNIYAVVQPRDKRKNKMMNLQDEHANIKAQWHS
jgi:hypothetical protein